MRLWNSESTEPQCKWHLYKIDDLTLLLNSVASCPYHTPMHHAIPHQRWLSFQFSSLRREPDLNKNRYRSYADLPISIWLMSCKMCNVGPFSDKSTFDTITSKIPKLYWRLKFMPSLSMRTIVFLHLKLRLSSNKICNRNMCLCVCFSELVSSDQFKMFCFAAEFHLIVHPLPEASHVKAGMTQENTRHLPSMNHHVAVSSPDFSSTIWAIWGKEKWGTYCSYFVGRIQGRSKTLWEGLPNSSRNPHLSRRSCWS